MTALPLVFPCWWVQSQLVESDSRPALHGGNLDLTAAAVGEYGRSLQNDGMVQHRYDKLLGGSLRHPKATCL